MKTLISIILLLFCACVNGQYINTYSAGNGQLGDVDFGILTKGGAGHALLGAKVTADLTASLHLGSEISGTRLFWHLSKRASTEGHFMHINYYNGSSFRTVLALNPNGNVGIGTNSPQTRLEVSGGRLAQSGAIANDNNATFVNTEPSGYGIYSKGGLGTRYAFHFENQAGTSILIGRGDGNVGIGTTYPQKPLDVNTGPNNFASFGSTLSIGQWSGLHFGYREDNASYRKSAIVFERVDNAANGKIHILNNNTGSQSATLTDARLTIDQTGNVGVGITNPTNKLQIGANPAGYTGNDLIVSSANGSLAIHNDAAETYLFANRAISIRPYGQYSFYAATNGNVGIGTINPDYKLTVNGKIKCEELQVVVDVPADYVFEKDYHLMPLGQVEKFVTENKHLPNLPNAETLKANGWQVGEMNNKLLEKIEELTLYMIEMKKENELLKERVEQLEKRK